MSTLWQNIRYKMLQTNSRLMLLIGINVIVYLVINIPATLEKVFMGHNLISLYADEYLNTTAYLPKLLVRLWTPFTYMFMHAGGFSHSFQYVVALLDRANF